MLAPKFAICGLTLTLLASGHRILIAQPASVPTAYTVTTKSAMGGPEFPTRTYRLGSKALIDQTFAGQGSTPAMHVRTLYDLDRNATLTWDAGNGNVTCSKGTFSGDWGDPFAGVDDLVKQGATQTGTEAILGRPARILEASDGAGGKIEAWVDVSTSLILKAELVPANGQPSTMAEVLEVNLTPPPASVFDAPVTCAAAAAAPVPPTEAEQIAALTGSDPNDFVNAIYGPGSKGSCTMVLRVVKAGTMESIADPYQVAIDLDAANEPAPNYTIGSNASGHTTFAGGGLHEITAQIRNGAVRVENVPSQFELEMAFGNAGSSGGTLYRQCFAPETVLLYVLKNPAEISDGGDWLWVKSGKYATVP